MENSKDGGPAFPNEGFNGWGDPQAGMTLRDYFAAKAMQAMLGAAASSTGKDDDFKQIAQSLSEMSYFVADAMLRARSAA